MRVTLLDIGATTIKSAKTVDGELGQVKRSPFPKPIENDDAAVREHDLGDIWCAVWPHIVELGDALLICNQMAGFVAFDDAGPIGNFVSCWDRRCKFYRRRCIDIATEIGLGCNLKMGIGDYIVWRLTGHKGPFHVTNDRRGYYYTGGVAEAGSCQVWSPIGDHQAAFHGCMVGDDELHVNIGTGGQVSMIDFGQGEGPELYQHRPGATEEQSLACVTHLPAGNWLRRVGDTVGNRSTMVRWYVEASRRLRPYCSAVVSGGLGLACMDMLERELGVKCRSVEHATLKGLRRLHDERTSSG